MRLLIDFLCRFAWGLGLGLVLTPATLVPAGFFRVNLLVLLGVASGAVFLARAEAVGGAWIPAAAAAGAAWVGSVAWYAERRSAGRACCVAAAACAAVATVSLQPARSPVTACGPLVSGAVTGLTVHAMLLGHWYLNAPGMRVDALRRMIDAALVAWGVQLAWSAATAATGGGGTHATAATGTALTALRWLAGLAGLPVLLLMSRKTLDIPNTQSATGILYVASLAAILGELTSQLLGAAS